MSYGKQLIQGAIGTATRADVLIGSTFSSAAVGSNKEGTIPNQGAPTLQPGASIPPGYYSGGQAASPGSGKVIYTSPGNASFTVGSGVTRLLIWTAGSGGGSGGSPSTSYYGGNGGSASTTLWWVSVTPGDVLSLTIPSGGTGGSSTTSNGSDGSHATLTSNLYGWTLYSGYGKGGTAATTAADGSSGSYVDPSQTSSAPVLADWPSNGYTQSPGGSVYASAIQFALDLSTSAVYPTNFGQASPSTNELAGAGGGGGNNSVGSNGNNGAISIYW